MKSKAKRLLSVAISLILLGVLIATVDFDALMNVLLGAHLGWFTVAVFFFVPQTLAIAWRWAMISEPIARIHWREAGRQVLASSCLNLVLPSKLGDLAKGVFLYRQGRCRLDDGLHIVVFEKLLDLAALSAWMVIGWILVPSMASWVLGVLALGLVIIGTVWLTYFTPVGTRLLLAMIPGFMRRKKKLAKVVEIFESGPRVMQLVHADGRRRNRIIGWSFIIWALHLAQIYCFFKTLGAQVDVFEVFARMPIAIFAGLMPLSIAGVGVRDWALVTVFASEENTRAILVGVGLLVSLRYVFPALAGMNFMPKYMLMAKSLQGGDDKGKPQRHGDTEKSRRKNSLPRTRVKKV